MSHNPTKDIRMLAIDPSTRGFGFAVIEGSERLVDWGTRSARSNKNRECLKKVVELIDCYQPDLIVLEKCDAEGSRRCKRVRRLIDVISDMAIDLKIKVRRFSRRQVQVAFSKFGTVNKHEIATAIAGRFPELAPHLPRYRKAWMSEDHSQAVFDAVGLAMAVFFQNPMKVPLD